MVCNKTTLSCKNVAAFGREFSWDINSLVRIQSGLLATQRDLIDYELHVIARRQISDDTKSLCFT